MPAPFFNSKARREAINRRIKKLEERVDEEEKGLSTTERMEVYAEAHEIKKELESLKPD